MRDAIDAELLRDHHRRLLPDDQRGRVRVRTDVGRADGEVRDFESLDTVHVQARIDDAASFAGFHRASAKLAPQPKKTKKNKNKRASGKEFVSQFTYVTTGRKGMMFSPNARSCSLSNVKNKKEKEIKNHFIDRDETGEKKKKEKEFLSRTHGAHVRLYRALVPIRIRDPRRVQRDGSLGVRNERRGPARRERGM